MFYFLGLVYNKAAATAAAPTAPATIVAADEASSLEVSSPLSFCGAEVDTDGALVVVDAEVVVGDLVVVGAEVEAGIHS